MTALLPDPKWRRFNAFTVNNKDLPKEGKEMLWRLPSGYFFAGARSGGMVIPSSRNAHPIPVVQIEAVAEIPHPEEAKRFVPTPGTFEVEYF